MYSSIPQKIPKKIKKLEFIMQRFSAYVTVFLKKNYFFPENMKKPLPRVAHKHPQLFLCTYWPGCPNSIETEILYHQKPLNAGLGV